MNVQTALQALRNLQQGQIQNAAIIVSGFMEAGLPAGVGLAAIPNAMAESALNHKAVGDNGNSVGLFQLNALGGARTFDGDRTDPKYNTKWIAEEYQRYAAKKGKIGNFVATESLNEAYARGATVAEMAGLFAAIIERPRDTYGEMTRRQALARQMFGSLADLPAKSFEQAALSGLAIAGLAALGLAVLGGGYFFIRRHYVARSRN